MTDLQDSALIVSDLFLFYMNINYRSVLPIYSMCSLWLHLTILVGDIKKYKNLIDYPLKAIREDSLLVLANNSIQCLLEGPPLPRFHS